MRTDLPTIRCQPIKWEILPEFYPQYGQVSGGVYVETRYDRHGNTSYAVTIRNSYELSKEGSVDYQPIPSERSEEYLAEHRWGKLDEAIAVAQLLAERCLNEAPTVMR